MKIIKDKASTNLIIEQLIRAQCRAQDADGNRLPCWKYKVLHFLCLACVAVRQRHLAVTSSRLVPLWGAWVPKTERTNFQDKISESLQCNSAISISFCVACAISFRKLEFLNGAYRTASKQVPWRVFWCKPLSLSCLIDSRTKTSLYARLNCRSSRDCSFLEQRLCSLSSKDTSRAETMALDYSVCPRL